MINQVCNPVSLHQFGVLTLGHGKYRSGEGTTTVGGRVSNALQYVRMREQDHCRA